jgi:ATP:ADP antiporter, AAA family
MSTKLGQLFDYLFQIDRSHRVKFFFLTCIYFFIIGAYTLVKELNNSIFMRVVGDDYLPWAKIASMFVLIPAILFYSHMVDKLRRYQLLAFYSFIYGVIGILFGYFLGSPIIGIANTQASPYRLFGWLFYFFIEGYSPFVVSVFWAFANSVTSPKQAKNTYSLMVSGSKLGGMFSAGFAWWFLSLSSFKGVPLNAVNKHQILFLLSSVMIIFVPILTWLLKKKVPGQELHGYEAAYQAEKSREKTGKIGLFSGLTMLIKQPYVLGIFGMIFFYEIINVVIGYLRLKLANQASCDLSDLSCILFEQIFYIHLLGFVISLIGTNFLLKRLGERRCLILLPLVTGGLIVFFLLNVTNGGYGVVHIVSLVFVGIRAVNYAIGYPVRESLYIPTVKDIKFKSKSWIDAFGSKIAKSCASQFNLIAPTISFLHPIFFSVIFASWFLTAYLLGNRYRKAVKNNEVIGDEISS